MVSASGPKGSKLGLRSTVYVGLMHALSRTEWVKRPPAGVVRKFGGRECQLRCYPRPLTTVENYEVSPKIALVLLRNGRLIYLNLN
ncbi:hypothetical protein AVEN_138896-2 [Araneus ventricosus]|uniref:Uncharacterized protein n=1 Tax=Araneus ventricosus TaxID=182803 RepID=A0A4Y2NXC0_ARAVE|nr:hypothetical protein AVEN_181592-2 [Araneus ventricosus]GBN42983.1 hypothetical protein AVEN_120606-2 [Araneus ventricosus]GBN43175.1 hypothetical protein AVEN_138896-2 [Araneus ventricosus]